MLPEAEGRAVAVVGRAASLLDYQHGAAIDAADLVVRIHWDLPLSGPVDKVGTRTDMIYCAGNWMEQVAGKEAPGICYRVVDHKLRKAIAREYGFDATRYRPTTGVVAIFDALRHGARTVRAFGFDFYATGYAMPAAPHNPQWVARRGWSHHYGNDRVILTRLRNQEKRFRPDTHLRGLLR